jgi:hypothetical protein
MPIQFHYDLDVGVLFTRAEGLLTFDEILRHLNEERDAKGIAHPEVFDATQARWPRSDSQRMPTHEYHGVECCRGWEFRTAEASLPPGEKINPSRALSH